MIYEYVCKNCNHKVEKFSFDINETEISCSICGNKADRIISTSPVGFNRADLKIQREFGHKM